MSWTRAIKKEWICPECGVIEGAYSESILTSLVELHKTEHKLSTMKPCNMWPLDVLRLTASDLEMFKEMGISHGA